MANHKQARELAALKGATRRHPERYRDEVPKSGYALGDVPAHMTAEAQTAWLEIETYSLLGVLTGSDRFILEIACELLADFRAAPKAFKVGKFSQLISCLGRLGLTPSDRQRLGVVKPKEPNPFDAF
jgi:phage terminase small subunit